MKRRSALRRARDYVELRVVAIGVVCSLILSVFETRRDRARKKRGQS